MKSFVFRPMVLMLTASFLVFGCSKERTVPEPAASTVKMTAADQAVMRRVLTFRQKVAFKKANPNFKSGEIVAIDSARWDVETNFNATYSFPDERYTTTRSDSAVLFLPVIDDSTTLMDDVLVFNEQVFTQVLALFNSSPFTNKELLFVSLKKSEMANGELEVKLKVVTGEKQATLYSFTPFGEGDDWKYGYFLGKCDGSQYLESDAAKELQNLLNLNKTSYCYDMPGPPSLFRKIYSDDPMSPYQLEGSEFKNEITGEYPMYYIEKNTPLTDDDLCLDYNEMNFHYNGEWAVIYDDMRAEYNRPCNWDFMLCDITGERETALPGSSFYDKAQHKNILFYSYHHWVRRDCIEDPISLSITTK